MTIRGLVLTLLILPLWPQSALADLCTTAGVELPETVRLAPDTPLLLMRGQGTRDKWIWPVYAAALYLPRSLMKANAREIRQADVPRRLRLHFLREVPREKLIEGWRDGFESNLDKHQQDRLESAFNRSERHFVDSRSGDRVDFDYRPGVGTEVRVNGVLQGQEPGQDFYSAVLSIWLGETPTQASLRQCLLSTPPGAAS